MMSSHPLDNIKIDEDFRASSSQLGAKHGIVGQDKMMGGKAGMFEDSKLVNFGAAREKAMARMGEKLVPYSIYSECIKGNQEEVRGGEERRQRARGQEYRRKLLNANPVSRCFAPRIRFAHCRSGRCSARRGYLLTRGTRSTGGPYYTSARRRVT